VKASRVTSPSGPGDEPEPDRDDDADREPLNGEAVEPPCPDCGGTVLRWGGHPVCTSCRRLPDAPDADAAGPEPVQKWTDADAVRTLRQRLDGEDVDPGPFDPAEWSRP
jgi:hypothetical protein